MLIRAGDVAETLLTMRPTPLRHGDVICIADECFLFESIVRPAPPQVVPAPLPPAQAYPLWPLVNVHPREGRAGQPAVSAAQAGAGAAGAVAAKHPDAAGDGELAEDHCAARASAGSGGAGSSRKGRASAGQAGGAAAGDEGGPGAGGSGGGGMAVSAAASGGAPSSGAAAGAMSGAGAAEAAGASSGSALLGMGGSCLAVPRHAEHEC